MKKILFYFIGVLILSNLSFSQITFFVNGAIGSDTAKDAGNTPKKPFKTINQALKIAGEKAEIIVEGQHEGKQIEYKEFVALNNIEMKFIGKNMPVLNGEIKESKEFIRNGITINADFITVDGFYIKNYNSKSENFHKFTTSAGIFATEDFQFTTITNCKIENCGNGIQLNNPQLSKINNCEIKSMKSANPKDFKAGGIGICIYGTNQNLQAIEIGTEGKNIISDCDLHGIFYGNLESESVGENTRIAKNLIQGTKLDAAIYISGTKSDVHVVDNEITGNFIGLRITGNNSDLWVDGNKFSKTTSNTEWISDSVYFGGLLKAFWFDNKNSFDKTTYAALNDDNSEIFSNNNERAVKNDLKSVEEISKGKLKIIKK